MVGGLYLWFKFIIYISKFIIYISKRKNFYMKTLNQPKEGDYPAFFSTYLKHTTGDNYEEQILKQMDELIQLFSQKEKDWADNPYQTGKWTPKEVLGHIIDTERIMAFR